MKHNELVDSTLEALDLEFEILGLAQQQSIMGGSGGDPGGSNGSNGGPNYRTVLIANMCSGASGGTFSGLSGDAMDRFQDALYNLSNTSTGLSLLEKLRDSGTQITLDPSALPENSNASAVYNYDTNTMNVSRMTTGAESMDVLAHDLFHAYDDHHGGTTGTTNTEGQALLLQYQIMKERGAFTPGVSNVGGSQPNPTTEDPNDHFQNGYQIAYNSAVQDIFANGFTAASFNTMKANLANGSLANQLGGGIYSGLTAGATTGENDMLPINEFFPHANW